MIASAKLAEDGGCFVNLKHYQYRRLISQSGKPYCASNEGGIIAMSSIKVSAVEYSDGFIISGW